MENKKNGMAVMIAIIFLYLVAIGGSILGGFLLEAWYGVLLFAASLVWICIGWIFLLGLKVLGPQEALVLTLFGRYIGTLKEAGFYYVNPFCVSVNPAAKTKLSQSGDVDGGPQKVPVLYSTANAGLDVQLASRKISLKVMTLNNNRQKINDCLGNPVEIGIAVTWRVVDTCLLYTSIVVSVEN